MKVRDTLGRYTGDKYTKINGVWYKGKCMDCNKLIKSHLAKRCKQCFYKLKKGVKPKHFEVAGYYKKQYFGTASYYTEIHSWIKKQAGQPNKCMRCGLVSNSNYKIHWANKSGEYKKDINDWIRLCASCHRKYDARLKERRVV